MRLGRIEVGASFLLVLALSLYWDEQGVVPPALLACVLHELGHLGALRVLGGRMGTIRLSGVGAEMQIQGKLGYGGEVAVALAGPATNLCLGVILLGNASMELFCGVNFALGLLNLIPAERLDGGRILYGISAALWGAEAAGRLSTLVGWSCALLLLVAGGWILAVGGSFTLLVLALWVVWIQKTWKFDKKTLA